jgi:aldose 1-epimerase
MPAEIHSPRIGLTSRKVGQLSDGRDVESWCLAGKGGLEVHVLNYGCTVTRILVPDRWGERGDVALGLPSVEDYLAGHPCFGSQIGRVAGRIKGARFHLEGREYPLAANDGSHHLHGGATGFDKRLWSAAGVTCSDRGISIRFRYQSADGEEGYPGRVDVEVTYTVTHDNVFVIETSASSDRPTPVNLTHHSYFNLAGEGSGPAWGHSVQVFSDTYVPSDETFALSGRLEKVGTNDLRQPGNVADILPRIFGRHGDLYRLDHGGSVTRAARLEDPSSGRVMEVSTDCDYLQFYTGVNLDGSQTGKSGQAYGPYAGLCFECQGCPSSLDHPELGNIVVRPGEVQKRTTHYAFSTH